MQYRVNDPSSLEAKLVPTSLLKPLEKVYPSHLKNIETMIFEDGVMKKPLLIDDRHNIVLDGSHRYAFLLKHGFQFAPVISVDYSDDSIFVGNMLKHRFLRDESFSISKNEIITRGLNGDIYDPRRTRHFFPFRKKDYPFELSKLKKGENVDIAFLLHDITISMEISDDKSYINEINEELKIIQNYIAEQKSVKAYFEKQILMMKEDLNLK